MAEGFVHPKVVDGERAKADKTDHEIHNQEERSGSGTRTATTQRLVG